MNPDRVYLDDTEYADMINEIREALKRRGCRLNKMQLSRVLFDSA